jgi:hypothetical protein
MTSYEKLLSKELTINKDIYLKDINVGVDDIYFDDN